MSLSMDVLETLDDLKCFIYENPLDTSATTELLSHINVAIIPIDIVELAKFRRNGHLKDREEEWAATLYQHCSSMLVTVQLVLIRAGKTDLKNKWVQ